MPFGWGDSEDAYKQVYENDQFDENKASFGHELAAGGAAFMGFKAFEDHQRKEGTPIYHTLRSYIHSLIWYRKARLAPIR